MKIKTKITLGLGLLFLIVFIISGFSIYYINKMSLDEKAIIKNNYQSLRYVSEMTRSLDAIRSYQVEYELGGNTNSLKNNSDYNSSFSNFENYLKAEENNITEPGERKLAYLLREDFKRLSSFSNNISTGNAKSGTYYVNNIHPLIKNMDNALTGIHDINMKAISYRNHKALSSSGQIVPTMSILISVCLVLAILCFVYFPTYLTFALIELTGKMKQIAEGKFDERLNLKSGDEFGEISEHFDKLLEHLQEKKRHV